MVFLLRTAHSFAGGHRVPLEALKVSLLVGEEAEVASHAFDVFVPIDFGLLFGVLSSADFFAGSIQWHCSSAGFLSRCPSSIEPTRVQLLGTVVTSTLVTTMGEVEVALPPFLLQETAALRIAGVVTLQADPRSFGMLFMPCFCLLTASILFLVFQVNIPRRLLATVPVQSCATCTSIMVSATVAVILQFRIAIFMIWCPHFIASTLHCLCPSVCRGGNVCVGDHRQLGCREGN